MPTYKIDGMTPVVDPSAFVHPTAVLIGDVIVGPGCYVGPAASLRGDFGRLILEQGSNIQDTCVMHSFPGIDCVVESNGHIGHGAVLHACRIGKNSLVGMNAVIMDEAVIAESCIVAACAFVKAKFTCEKQSLIAGIPAERIRELSEKELAWKQKGTAAYQHLALRSANSMQEVEPLDEIETGRRRFSVDDLVPLSKLKT